MEAGRKFGYIRVSTKEQNVDRQIDSLSKYVNDPRNIVIDKSSGKDFDRPNYNAIRQFSAPGDEIYIHSLDRLGRDKKQIKEELSFFRDKGVFIRCLDIPTTLIDYAGFGDLQRSIFDMVNNILIEVLGYQYEQERKITLQRQAEGIAAARLRGKRFGRPKIKTPDNWSDVYGRWKNKKITAVSAMSELALKPNTFYRMVQAHEGRR